MDTVWFRSGEFYSIASALMWAIGVILFRKSGESVPPLALNMFKDTVGLILVALTLAVLQIPFVPETANGADWAILLISGVMGIGVSDTLFFASLNRLGAGWSAIVDCLYSPFVLLCSFLYLSEPIGWSLAGAIVLMAAAILIGTGAPGDKVPASTPAAGGGEVAAAGLRSTTALAGDNRLVSGLLLGIVAMLLMAMGIVLAKPVLNHSDPWWATSVRLTGGFVFLAGFGLLPRHRREMISAFRPNAAWRVMLPGAFIGTYIAVILWTAGMKYTYTTTASVLNQMSNVFILALAALFLREPLGWRQYAAIALGFAAGALVAL